MKKLLFFAMCAAMVLGIASCSNNNGPLTESAAKSALQDSRLFVKDGYVHEFYTGYYVVTDVELNNLAKLQAAGVIEYTVEEFTEYTDRVYYAGYYTGYAKRTIETKHQFAKVSLTKEGQKYEVEKPEWYPKYLAKYAKAMKDFEEAMPDFMDASHGNVEVEEAVAVTEVADSLEFDYYDDIDVEVAEDRDTRNDAYNNALVKVNSEEHYMLMGKIKLDEVVIVECTDEMYKNGKGKCVFVYSLKDKTPFGFVYSSMQDGAYKMGEATFKLTTNRGWILSDIDE